MFNNNNSNNFRTKLLQCLCCWHTWKIQKMTRWLLQRQQTFAVVLSIIFHIYIVCLRWCTHAKMIYLYRPNDSCFAIRLLAPFFSWDNVAAKFGWKGVIFICGHTVPVTMEIPNSFWYFYATSWLKENNPLFTCLQSLFLICLEVPAGDTCFHSEIVRAHPPKGVSVLLLGT